MDVLLGVGGEVRELGDGGDVLGPARHGLVLDLEVGGGHDLEVSGHGVEVLSLVRVLGADQYLGEAGEDVELGQVEAGEAVDCAAELHLGDVEPSAPAGAAGGGSELVAVGAEVLSGASGLVDEL